MLTIAIYNDTFEWRMVVAVSKCCLDSSVVGAVCHDKRSECCNQYRQAAVTNVHDQKSKSSRPKRNDIQHVSQSCSSDTIVVRVMFMGDFIMENKSEKEQEVKEPVPLPVTPFIPSILGLDCVIYCCILLQ